MFMITERDRKLARRYSKCEEDIQKALGDVDTSRNPVHKTRAAEFIAHSTLEQILEERTRLLRLRYCRGIDPEFGVYTLVTTVALWGEYDGESAILTHRDILAIIRRFVSEEIAVEDMRGPFDDTYDQARSLTLPGYNYVSFYLHYRP